MAGWIADGVVVLTGLAHALAAYLYYSRERVAWLPPLAWLLATGGALVMTASDPWLGYGLFAVIVGLWTLWWLSLRPSRDAAWVPENQYQATGTIVGDLLTVQHVRAFDWTAKRIFAARWETRTYDLARLQALDLFVCTWGDPRIAHTMVSFDFGDEHPLCFSIETRRETGEKWTALAGFMRSYELIMIAGDERDLVRARVNLRGETVRLYRIASEAAVRRRLLARYVAQMNRLAQRPRFYNTVFSNCTTEIGRLVYAAGHRFPLDWRLLVSGYLAGYLYDIGLIGRHASLEDVMRAADIKARSEAADRDPAYSRRIRENLVDPGTPEDVRRRQRVLGPAPAG
jgi:hypothetical protein